MYVRRSRKVVNCPFHKPPPMARVLFHRYCMGYYCSCLLMWAEEVIKATFRCFSQNWVWVEGLNHYHLVFHFDIGFRPLNIAVLLYYRLLSQHCRLPSYSYCRFHYRDSIAILESLLVLNLALFFHFYPHYIY